MQQHYLPNPVISISRNASYQGLPTQPHLLPRIILKSTHVKPACVLHSTITTHLCRAHTWLACTMQDIYHAFLGISSFSIDTMAEWSKAVDLSLAQTSTTEMCVGSQSLGTKLGETFTYRARAKTATATATVTRQPRQSCLGKAKFALEGNHSPTSLRSCILY